MDNKPSTDFQTLKRLIKQAAPHKKLFWSALVMGILVSAISPIRPILMQRMIDDYIIQFDARGLQIMTVTLIILLFLETFLRYALAYITSWLGQSVIKDIRMKIFQHIQNLKMRFFDKTPIGTSTTRVINDVEAINSTFSEGIISIITDVLTLVFVIGAMFWLNWKIALMSLSTFPLLLIATYIFKEKIKFAFRIIREKVSQMNAFVQERITGMRIIQVFNAEERERKKFEKINYDHLDANLKSVWYYSIFFPIVEIILALAIAFMVWSASTEAIKDQASIGVFTSFLLLLNMAFRPLRMLADKFNTLQMGVVSSERVFRILDLKDTTESYGTLKPEKLRGNIEFKEVWFAYNDDDYVMKGVSFKVNQGEMLAIIGATGSGKTTITNLINKFYQINKGEILIDDINIDEYNLFALRKRIAIVLQDVFLFSGTIYENITLHNEIISLETVIEAAKDVGAHEFIMNLPGGYQYEVMERGATLSVGQRQLIAFIRALVYNPDVLILDEATSSVDRESEILIQNATEKLVSGRTSLVIAHRLSTIQKADKILVMESGEVKEMGSHRELIADKDGHYKKLYEMQFK